MLMEDTRLWMVNVNSWLEISALWAMVYEPEIDKD
jgi:hypothetical protein